jgi:hypothetical protein
MSFNKGNLLTETLINSRCRLETNVRKRVLLGRRIANERVSTMLILT